MKYRDEETTPICTTENMPLFVMYIKKELPREQEKTMDEHLEMCSDCRANCAYVEEIINYKHPLGIDEKSLLLKYISDPLWYYATTNLKKQILNEILSEIKPLLKDPEAKLPILESNKPSNNSIPTYTLKENSKIANKNTPQKYSYFVLATVFATFIALTSSILLITKTLYPNSLSFLPLSKPSSVESISGINNRQANAENNLYEQLDSAIDKFLSTKNEDYLNKASTIAKDIEENNQDKYGVDLVAYYKTIPALAIEPLLLHRKKLNELTNQDTGDNYKHHLETSQKLEKEFFAFGDLIDAYKTKALINKLHVQLHNDEAAKLIAEEGLKFATTNKYLFLETDFLLWRAKRLCEIPDFITAEESFLQAIELGNRLNLDKSVKSAGMSLAIIYSQADENEKAYALAQKLLTKFTNYKNAQAITLLQLAGITSFNLHYKEMGSSYLKEAIKNSKEMNNSPLIARSYAFLGLIRCEQGEFSEVDELYNKAELEINKSRYAAS